MYFFKINTNASLFDDLYISGNVKLCEDYLGKYPVISISLKGVEANSYQLAKAQLIRIINHEARRFEFLLENNSLSDVYKTLFLELLDKNMDEATLANSLLELTELLKIYYRKEVIILIDEYDVPLARAYENGYYDEMVLLLRNLFGNALKSNDNLKFAVLTGCLRIAKESIFSGLNNFKVYSVTSTEFDETFGFTDNEVK